MPKDRSEYTVQALADALRMLEAIGQGPEMGVRELAKHLGMSHSKVHRSVLTLEASGYLLRNADNGRYRLSPKLFHLGAGALHRTDLLRVARPPLVSLSRESDEMVQLGILDGDAALMVEHVPTSHPLQLMHRVGERLPLYCTATGKALIAWLTPEERRRLLGQGPLTAFTRFTLSLPDQVEADLEATRHRGYAINDEERHDGIRSVAAPVRDHRGSVVASVVLGGPTVRVLPEHVPRLGRMVIATANEISRQIGYSGADFS